jgi:serine protease Do
VQHTASAWGVAFAAMMAVASLGCESAAPPGPAELPGSLSLALVRPAYAGEATLRAPPPSAPPTPGGDLATVVDRVRGAVVTVLCRSAGGDDDPLPLGPIGPHASRKHLALGSGFVLTPEGLVVTNEHVVHGADGVRVRFADGREVGGRVVAKDARLDVALLAVDDARDLSTAMLGSSRDVRVGDFVVAIGNPFGLGPAVTFGIVSAKARDIGAGPYDDFIQTDAAINPGSSGGPLFDTQGRVIGMNTVLHAHGRGIGFAIPIDDVREVLPELRATGRVARGRIGVGFQELTAELAQALGVRDTEGALVTDVEVDGPAGRAGLRPGDFVTSFDGSVVAHASELSRELGRRKPGRTVRLQIVREGKARSLLVGLTPLSEPEEPRREQPPPRGPARPGELGAELSDASGGGAVVERVEPDGPAEEKLEPGDVIVEADGRKVHKATDLTAHVASKSKPSMVLLRLRRGPAFLFQAVALPPVGKR